DDERGFAAADSTNERRNRHPWDDRPIRAHPAPSIAVSKARCFMAASENRPRSKGPAPDVVAALPSLCHKPSGIAVLARQSEARGPAVNQTSISMRSFFDAGVYSHFFAPLHQHDFCAVNWLTRTPQKISRREFWTGGE